MWRFMQFGFATWFAISMTLANVTISTAQTPTTSTGSATASPGTYSSVSSAAPIDTRGYKPDQSESQALSEYLKQRKLPLVGAQVLQGATGGRIVVLYGFVGSEFGKADAAKKAQNFLGDSTVTVDNRINVRPELLAANHPSGTPANTSDYNYRPPATANSAPQSSSDGSSGYPGPDSYKAQQSSPYVQQLTSMMPLIALLGALGMGIAGGGSGFSFGASPFASRSYGNPYYRPYTPYGGVPYSSPPNWGPPYGNPALPSTPYIYP